MPRRLRAREVRDQYDRDRSREAIRPINEFVDRLRLQPGRGEIPWVDPYCGGVDAQVMFLAQDPGPKASRNLGGSGSLSIENDDPSAESVGALIEQSGIGWRRSIPWNAVPWYVGGTITAETRAGAEAALLELIAVLPELRFVILMGGHAQASWKRFSKTYPTVSRRLESVPTLHPSTLGLTRGGRQTNAEGFAQVLEILRRVAEQLDDPNWATGA